MSIRPPVAVVLVALSPCLHCGSGGDALTRAGGDWSGTWESEPSVTGASFSFRVDDEQRVAGVVSYQITAGTDIPFPCPQVVQESADVGAAVPTRDCAIIDSRLEFQVVEDDGSRLGVQAEFDAGGCGGIASGSLYYEPPVDTGCPGRDAVWTAVRDRY